MLRENTTLLAVFVHMRVVLADGKLEGYEVECPWHSFKFDVRTGEVTSPPASEQNNPMK
jgi:glycine betaine catabolism B